MGLCFYLVPYITVFYTDYVSKKKKRIKIIKQNNSVSVLRADKFFCFFSLARTKRTRTFRFFSVGGVPINPIAASLKCNWARLRGGGGITRGVECLYRAKCRTPSKCECEIFTVILIKGPRARLRSSISPVHHPALGSCLSPLTR